MTLAVVDASVRVVFYAGDDERRPRVVDRPAVGDALFAPVHLDAEIVSALRAISRTNPDVDRLVPRALSHLAEFPIRRLPLAPLFERVWELRHNMTAYDTAYVAQAERLDAVLITCDRQLAAAGGARCRVDVLA